MPRVNNGGIKQGDPEGSGGSEPALEQTPVVAWGPPSYGHDGKIFRCMCKCGILG